MYAAMALYVLAGVIGIGAFRDWERAGGSSAYYVAQPRPVGDSPVADVVFFLVVPLAVWLWVVRRCLRGSEVGRSAATVLCGAGGLAAASLAVTAVHGFASRAGELLFVLPALAAVVLLWSARSAPHFDDDRPLLRGFATGGGPRWGPAAAPAAASESGPGVEPLLGPGAHKHRPGTVPPTVRAALRLIYGAMGFAVLSEAFIAHRIATTLPTASDPGSPATTAATPTVSAAVFANVLIALSLIGLWVWLAHLCRRGVRGARIAATLLA
ncbi:hypothetical protein, partial [Actinacidiphila rubida]